VTEKINQKISLAMLVAKMDIGEKNRAVVLESGHHYDSVSVSDGLAV